MNGPFDIRGNTVNNIGLN